MKYFIHEGMTADPDNTLPNGQQEIGSRELLSQGQLRSFSDLGDQIAFKIRRKLSNAGAYRKKPAAESAEAQSLASDILAWINENRNGRPVVSVMAPWYEDSTLEQSEGYIRRIREIDGSVLNDCICIYFYECPYYKVNRLVVDRISDTRLYVRYNTDFRSHREFVDALIVKSDWCYCHSVLRLIPAFHPENAECWLEFSGKIPEKIILDIHGAVVEEAKMIEDAAAIPWAEKAEKILFGSARYAISLTESMEQYYSAKYGRADMIFFRTPVLSRDISGDGETYEKESDPPIVVYSGGCQKWQNIDLMIRAIKDNLDRYVFNIFVSRPDIFADKWGSDPIPGNVIVKNGAPNEITEVYKKARFGFILRDDTVLNRVACPTKLMEYIQFGIIPVVKSANIGDFRKLGLRTVSVAELSADRDRAATRCAAEKNSEIVNQLRTEYKHNIRKLTELLQDTAKT